jgi:DNA-binding NtrC family response regulator
MLPRILIVTSRSSRLGQVASNFDRDGALVTRAESVDDLWKRVARESFDLVVLRREDVPNLSSHLVAEIRALPEQPDVVVVSLEEDPDELAELLTAGCLAVVSEGLDEAKLSRTLEALLQRRREQEERSLETAGIQPFHLSDYASSSPTMHQFLDTARRVVGADSTLLLLGETGVGKEWLARAIHADGPRAGGPFVAVNCSAFPETLLESELFGHEKGAFTGAARARRGYFELAHRGTIFLDEIAELPVHLQVKLLRALEERRIQPLGSERSIAVDVRVIAATNRDLELEVREKRFRADLFYRLNVVSLTLPPLRERREDVPELVKSYLDLYRARLRGDVIGVDSDALAALAAYDWPGNVRELINAVERAVLMATGPTILLADLPDSIRRFAPDCRVPDGDGKAAASVVREGECWGDRPWRVVRKQILEQAERRYLSEVLALSSGRIGEAARRAGMAPRSLFEKMRRHGFRKEDYRDSTRPTEESPAR